ncbi:MAG: TolC family outer membrane protein, partial [Methylococcaceae bacterium]|nr:TolC family outer membrane protein [Methylococcaceae bacterium]
MLSRPCNWVKPGGSIPATNCCGDCRSGWATLTSSWLINDAGGIALQSDFRLPSARSHSFSMTVRPYLFAAFALFGQAKAQDLMGIYDQALQHDPSLKESQATLHSAEEYRPQGIARLMPQISATATLNRNSVLTKSTSFVQNTIAGGRNLGYWDSSGTLRLVQPIYHHEYWVQLSAADNQIAKAQANAENALQNLGLRTAQGYFDLLYALDSLEFAKAERQALERQLEQAKARFEVGLIAITDVNEAQAGYDQASANIIKAENELDNAREALREFVGEFDTEVRGLGESIPLPPPAPADLEQWGQRATEANLGVIALENDAEIYRKTIELRFAGHLPAVDLVGTAGFTDNNRPFGASTESQTIGIQATLPLFQGGMINSQIAQARYDLEAAQERLDKQRRAANKQAKNAYRGVLSSVG